MFSPPPSPLPKAQPDDHESKNTDTVITAKPATGVARPNPPAKRRKILIVFSAITLVFIAASYHYLYPSLDPVLTTKTVEALGTTSEWIRAGIRSHAHGRWKRADPPTNGTSSTTSAPAIPVPPFPVPNPFPQPFDVTLSYNFTSSSCYQFFQSFTQDPTFRYCRPLSLLLSSSEAFADAQRNLTAMTAIIGGTCDTTLPLEQCETNMTRFATQIQSVCTEDLRDRNSVVLQALNGFQSFSMYRQAGCLRNLRTNTYCYADALTTSSATDLYYYNIGIGAPIPRTAIPTCSACVQTLMTLYATYATNSMLLISETYAQAATIATKTCGANYAKVPGAKTGDASRAKVGSLSSIAVIIVLVASWWTLY